MKPNSRPCLSLFKSPHISKDGKVCVCCRDFYLSIEVGDITKNSLEEIWFGEKVTEYRIAHIRGHFGKTPLCLLCNENPTLTDEEVLEFLKFHKREDLYPEYVKRVGKKTNGA
jgi:hypothetical protein